MTVDALKRQLRSARRQRSLFVVMTLLLLVANLFFVSSFTQVQRTTVLVPTRISDGMVAVGAVDHRFVQSMARDAVYAFYTVAPETTNFSRDMVARLSSLRDRSKNLDAFDAVAKDIRERRISTVFFPEKVESDASGLRVVVTGILATYIETTETQRQPRTVTVTFVEEAASVRLASISAAEVES